LVVLATTTLTVQKVILISSMVAQVMME